MWEGFKEKLGPRTRAECSCMCSGLRVRPVTFGSVAVVLSALITSLLPPLVSSRSFPCFLLDSLLSSAPDCACFPLGRSNASERGRKQRKDGRGKWLSRGQAWADERGTSRVSLPLDQVFRSMLNCPKPGTPQMVNPTSEEKFWYVPKTKMLKRCSRSRPEKNEFYVELIGYCLFLVICVLAF